MGKKSFRRGTRGASASYPSSADSARYREYFRRLDEEQYYYSQPEPSSSTCDKILFLPKLLVTITLVLLYALYKILIFLLKLAIKAFFFLPSLMQSSPRNGSATTTNADDNEPITIPTDPQEAVLRIMSEREDLSYRILGATPASTGDEIKKLYRKQSLLIHPDKNKHTVRCPSHAVLKPTGCERSFQAPVTRVRGAERRGALDPIRALHVCN